MTEAIFQTVVAGRCERHDCTKPSEVVTVVTGDIGEDGIAAYCAYHADMFEDRDSHTPIGEVTHVRGNGDIDE